MNIERHYMYTMLCEVYSLTYSAQKEMSGNSEMHLTAVCFQYVLYSVTAH